MRVTKKEAAPRGGAGRPGRTFRQSVCLFDLAAVHVCGVDRERRDGNFLGIQTFLKAVSGFVCWACSR
jgi:hypothetical protein